MPGTRRRLSADVRREQIIETSAELFIRDGFENVKMSDIAERLETSRPNIYTYYPSTEAILEVILERHTKAYLDDLSQTFAAVEGIPTLEQTFEAMLRHKDLFLLLNSGGGPSFRKHRDLVSDAMDNYSLHFHNFGEGQDTPTSGTRAVAALTRLLLVTSLLEYVSHPERYDLDELVQLVGGMLYTGYQEVMPDVSERLQAYAKKAKEASRS